MDASSVHDRLADRDTPACKPSELPDGTPIRVLAWEEATALVEHDAGHGHLRRCRIRRARAAELLRQADAEQLRTFACRSRRSERIGRQRYRDLMIARAHRGARDRQARGSAPRRRGSRRGSGSRAAPGDDAGPSGDDDPDGEPLPREAVRGDAGGRR